MGLVFFQIYTHDLYLLEGGGDVSALMSKSETKSLHKGSGRGPGNTGASDAVTTLQSGTKPPALRLNTLKPLSRL